MPGDVGVRSARTAAKKVSSDAGPLQHDTPTWKPTRLHSMASDKGYRIRRDAAPRELCERAALEMAAEPPTSENASVLEYAPNDTCRKIVRYVLEVSHISCSTCCSAEEHQTHSAEVTALKTEVKPTTINVARLRKIDWSRISGSPGLLYFVVALTPLDPSSGWYRFLQQDASQSEEEWEEETVRLDPGDAFIWRGECLGKPGDGEGGLMLVVTFR